MSLENKCTRTKRIKPITDTSRGAQKSDPLTCFLGCPDILELIFTSLSPMQLQDCQRVSKGWNEYIKEHIFSKKRINNFLWENNLGEAGLLCENLDLEEKGNY